jgi:hypothetical protein
VKFSKLKVNFQNLLEDVRKRSSSGYEPTRRPEPNLFFLASSNLGDEISYKGGSL